MPVSGFFAKVEVASVIISGLSLKMLYITIIIYYITIVVFVKRFIVFILIFVVTIDKITLRE